MAAVEDFLDRLFSDPGSHQDQQIPWGEDPLLGEPDCDGLLQPPQPLSGQDLQQSDPVAFMGSQAYTHALPHQVALSLPTPFERI